MCSDAHGLSAAMPLRADACPLTGREIRKTTAMEIAGCVFTGHFLPHWRASSAGTFGPAPQIPERTAINVRSTSRRPDARRLSLLELHLTGFSSAVLIVRVMVAPAAIGFFASPLSEFSP
jgi:hypothetical protein